MHIIMWIHSRVSEGKSLRAHVHPLLTLYYYRLGITEPVMKVQCLFLCCRKWTNSCFSYRLEEFILPVDQETNRRWKQRSNLTTGWITYPLFTETQRAFSLFNWGFPLGSSPPYIHASQPIFNNDNIYFAAGGVLAKHWLMSTRRSKFPIRMDGNYFSSCSSALNRETTLHPSPRRWELMEQFVITSHHIQPVTGGFVGLGVSSALRFYLCLGTPVCFGAFACRWGCVECSDRNWENMSEPVLDQSSHHSRSVWEDKMQTVTSGSLAAAAAAASAKAQTRLRHLCYLCHHIMSFMFFSASLPAPLCLFLSFTRSCGVNLESEIRAH